MAKALAGQLRALGVSTDDYVRIKNGDVYYTDRLDLSALASDIESALSQEEQVVLEGICLRNTAARLSLQVNLFVYTKVISAQGLWHDGLNLEEFERGEYPIKDLGEPGVSDFHYHRQYRPHERADIVYRRSEHNP
ncbi:MAG: hypothetical protein QNJ94_16910 [Alphaproteobacteria bacterium]|nr:hypothetical protein [Alphaproteobacteria bacterium]